MGSFSIAFICGWKLAIILVVCVPIIIYASYKQAILLKQNQMRDALSMDNAGRVRIFLNLFKKARFYLNYEISFLQVASETVRNIRTVQSLGQEKLFTDIYAGHLEAPYM